MNSVEPIQCTAGEWPSSISFCWTLNVMVTNTEKRVLVTQDSLLEREEE